MYFCTLYKPYRDVKDRGFLYPYFFAKPILLSKSPKLKLAILNKPKYTEILQTTPIFCGFLHKKTPKKPRKIHILRETKICKPTKVINFVKCYKVFKKIEIFVT